MKAGPSPVQRQRSSVRGLIFHRAASSTWLRCVTDICVSFAFGRMPANETGGAPGRAAGGRKERRREECGFGGPKRKMPPRRTALSGLGTRHGDGFAMILYKLIKHKLLVERGGD